MTYGTSGHSLAQTRSQPPVPQGWQQCRFGPHDVGAGRDEFTAFQPQTAPAVPSTLGGARGTIMDSFWGTGCGCAGSVQVRGPQRATSHSAFDIPARHGSSPTHEQPQTSPVAQSRSDWHLLVEPGVGRAAPEPATGMGARCELGVDGPHPATIYVHATAAATLTAHSVMGKSNRSSSTNGCQRDPFQTLHADFAHTACGWSGVIDEDFGLEAPMTKPGELPSRTRK